jgi:mannose-6-phosphate isomerase-like protein (cupin superfamily)
MACGLRWSEAGSEMNMKRVLIFTVAVICFSATPSYAQRAAGRGGQPQPTAREDALDPTPINAADPDIGMFVNDWRNAKPRNMYGELVFHDILTRLEGSDPVRPTRRGAVLTAIMSVSYATLAPGVTASGRAQKGERQIFFASAGAGTITVNSRSYDLKDGTGFTLTPDFDFKLTSTGKEPLGFYVRTEPVPENSPPSTDIEVVNRFDNDRRIGAHWVHICNGGPNGMNLCTIAPHTMPQPHSHAGEEAWIMVKGQSILSLGKNIVRMGPGQAYKIPPTGLAAHSNLNMSEEPIEMIYMGPAGRVAPAAGVQTAPARQGGPPAVDYARLDNSPIDRATEQDVDLFMGNWHDAFPRMMHGNLYFRDMLTALQGADSLHPARKGAVLVNAEAVSYAMLEPGASAHPIDGELKGIQETFVVNSGTGVITSGSKKVELTKDMAFVITPGLDYRLTATGEKYLTFYVVSEKLSDGFAPKTTLEVTDNRARPQVTKAWVNKERPVITRENGLSQYGALIRVEQNPMTMSQPYSDAPGVEEIWIATDGDIDMLFGKQLRKLPAGTAYRVPATGITAHANINLSDKTARLLYMVK